MNDMFIISEKIYYENYNYNYLSKTLEKCKCENIETLVVGNSYPLTGIDSKSLLNKSENLSISSQDLYYSYKLAEEVINNNENIKRCIIGAGYYLVNHDLSKCKSESSTNMIKYLYYPILKDKHNSEELDTIEISNLRNTLNNNLIEYIFNLEFLDEHFIDLLYRENNGYFNKNMSREMISVLRGVKLSSIIEDEKYRLGEIRASQHNDLSKYTETKKEYNLIFNDFINFLEEKGVEPVIVVFPTTKYYSKFINETYKEEFYKIIDGIKEKYTVKLVDFSKIDIFEEDDFIDFDHMSESGCIKITHELNKILN
ncbi:D-alanyl-lipoteichoic acid biosynthesis protein DltD [Paraclostridium sordellii]|uniref:D-alanyl-lipoteichoic acid biosynthesis protein DltD n=2 Tax=Paraclostridium sordellii TaxID=1505 RepID=UPI0005E517CB|nr:D-alanyl-lipoteichoic acid biosynthesis protein DltD [Paeniclostridium sordellii]CEO31505.1 putative chemotaxis response regulator [[Clostridium] sordellii] [Paeniclostridium sordellii]CEP49414.1 putative chemotaxis response regulator [[Clostridium] sordellii] [Paeniclostridium sordellii]